MTQKKCGAVDQTGPGHYLPRASLRSSASKGVLSPHPPRRGRGGGATEHPERRICFPRFETKTDPTMATAPSTDERFDYVANNDGWVLFDREQISGGG